MDTWIQIIVSIIIVIILIIMLRGSASIGAAAPATPTLSFSESLEGYRGDGYYGREDIDCIIDPTLAKCNSIGESPYY